MGWGAYSTPPVLTNVATPLGEGVLPPFPEHDDLVGDDKKLTPMWKRWFTKQRSWLADRGAYTPTEISFSGMGTAAVTGTPILHWWKQGNIIQIYLDLQLTTVSAGGGAMTIKPLPFDPSTRILQTGRSTNALFTVACMTYNGSVWASTPAYCFNGKSATTNTFIQVLNIPISSQYFHINGTYITDN